MYNRSINLLVPAPPACKKCGNPKTVVRQPGNVMIFCRHCDNI